MKLNIGCGDRRRDGFINIDVRETIATDAISEAWDLGVFANETVDEIYTRHMIEHLLPKYAWRAINEWHRVLKPKGLLQVICPDLEFHCKQYLGFVGSAFPDQRSHSLAGFYGWRSEGFGGEEFDLHRWGYDYEELSNLMGRCGFAIIERVRKGEDSEPWHLNVRATKV